MQILRSSSFILLLFLSIGCAAAQPANKDVYEIASGDVAKVAYNWTGPEKNKVESITWVYHSPEETVTKYYKDDVEQVAAGIFRQEIDAGKTYSDRASDMVGTSYVYFSNGDVVAQAIYKDDDVVGNMIVYENGEEKKVYDNRDWDKTYDVLQVFENGEVVREEQVSIPVDTPVSELIG